MYNKFIQALAWNTGAAFFYKVALLTHQITLYAVMPTALYGVQSSLFALLYAAIACTNFGFDDTLLPFFSTYGTSRSWLKLVRLQVIIHALSLLIAAVLFVAILTYSSGEFLHTLQNYCNKNLFFALGCLFFIENCKRSVVALMQLAFLHKQIAYAQIGMLYAYIATIWSLYGWYGSINLTIIFVPMVVYAGIETSYLVWHCLQYYRSVPQEQGAPSIPFKVLVMQRWYSYCNQLAKVVYNQNSMTIFFAYTLGFTQAATIKFFTNIITLCYTCIAKSVGVTTGALLATTRSSMVQAHGMLTNIVTRYLQSLGIFSIVMFTVMIYAYVTGIITQVMAWQIILFFIIGFLDHAGVVYEQWLIVRGKVWLLALVHGVGMVGMTICWYGYRHSLITVTSLVVVLVTIKIMTLFCIRRSVSVGE